MRRGIRVLAALLVMGAASRAVPARAQPAAGASVAAGIEGTILAVQGDDFVVDLGASRGASPGAGLELWRPIQLKHPVTGKVLTDRFRIGGLELVQVQKTLSIARASGELARPAQVGDVVILAVAAPVAPSPSASPTPTPSAPAPGGPAEQHTPEDPEARAVSDMFDGLQGTDLWKRIRAYEDYVRAHPAGRFARVLAEEAAALRELAADRGRMVEENAHLRVVSFAPPEDALAGAPLRITIELDTSAEHSGGAVLQIRKKGAPGYVSLPMSAIGGGYFAVTVPGDRVVLPAVEYFIEATPPSGKAEPVLGTPEEPRRLDVFETPHPSAPRRLPAHVEIATDYADYNRLRGNDHAWQTEGWFGIRLGDTGVRALRTGFGVYRGVGGSVNDLDNLGLAPRSVGLTYGWLETEIGFVRAFSMGGRVAVGLLDSGVSGGGQIMFRIGSDLGTNLLVAGEILGGVGLRGIAQLELATFQRFPILLRTEVGNQPAGVASGASQAGTSAETSDIGVRGIVQAGFRVTSDLTLSLRGSFQGRTIHHAGPGVGGAVGYSW